MLVFLQSLAERRWIVGIPVLRSNDFDCCQNHWTSTYFNPMFSGWEILEPSALSLGSLVTLNPYEPMMNSNSNNHASVEFHVCWPFPQQLLIGIQSGLVRKPQYHFTWYTRYCYLTIIKEPLFWPVIFLGKITPPCIGILRIHVLQVLVWKLLWEALGRFFCLKIL